MTTKPQNAVQSTDTVIRALLRLHGALHMSWAKIAACGQYRGIPAGTLCAISKGRDPKNPHVRAQLHLPALIPAPACVECGEVHTTKDCVYKRKPRKPSKWVRVLGHAGWEEVR